MNASSYLCAFYSLTYKEDIGLIVLDDEYLVLAFRFFSAEE